MRFVRDLALILSVVLGLAAGSQVSSFVDAYAQRLGGAVDEAARSVAVFQDIAAKEGLTFKAYLNRLAISADRTAVETAKGIRELVERLETLRQAQAALSEAGPWSRPLSILFAADSEILENTYADWSPGLTIDPRWGGIGGVLGWLLHGLVSALLVRGFTGRGDRDRPEKIQLAPRQRIEPRA